MKAIITKLDYGYTVSVELPAQGELPAEKKRFAFENRMAMLNYITDLFPMEMPVNPEPGEDRPDDLAVRIA